MYSLKGFITIPIFEDNVVGSVSPIGELSTRSRTYSREVGLYADELYQNVNLVSFSSQDETGKIEVSPAYRDNVLKVTQWIYEQCIDGTFSNDGSALVSAILTEFSPDLEDLSIGEMVTDGTYWLPEFITWKAKNTGPDEGSGLTTVDNQIKLWFSDESFQSQYDEYEIVVIPPLENLDQLFDLYETVNDLISARDLSNKILNVENATGGDPYTYLRNESFDWLDQFSDTNTIETNWLVAIYGIAGNNIDNIKNALTTYALENSSHTREEWLVIMPDLFRISEFIIRPLWEFYSIPNETLVAGIYSPVGRVKDLTALAEEACVGYETNHVTDVVEFINFIYKSIGLLIVGSPENRDGLIVFSDFITDYINVPTTSLDFNRMQPETQEWVNLMYSMVKEAEEMTDFSTLEVGFSRVYRDENMYVAYNFSGFNFLMLSKQTVTG